MERVSSASTLDQVCKDNDRCYVGGCCHTDAERRSWAVCNDKEKYPHISSFVHTIRITHNLDGSKELYNRDGVTLVKDMSFQLQFGLPDHVDEVA